MRPAEVRLTATARRAIERAALAAWPREMAAALGGSRSAGALQIERVVPFAGAGDAHGFAVPPAAFVAAEAQFRDAGCEWLGFVHSHPGGTASPSTRDRVELWRGCVQLLVGGASADDLRFAAFWFAGDTCTPLRVRHEAAEAPA